jgi:hypothetical protein
MPSWAQFVQGVTTILNSSGTALARRKTLQFGTGLEATDDGEKTVVIATGGASVTSDDVSNESGVAGATVTAALDQLDADIAAVSVTSDDVSNESTVPGVTVTDALNAISSGGLGVIEYFNTSFSPVVLYNGDTGLADQSGNGHDMVEVIGSFSTTDILPGQPAIYVPVGCRLSVAGTDAQYQISGDVTIMATFMMDLSPSTSTGIIFCGQSGTLEANNHMYLCQIRQTAGAGTRRGFRMFWEHSGGVDDDFNTDTDIGGPPTHVITQVVWRRSGTTAQIFVNGVPFGSASTGLSAPTGGSGGKLQIGGVNPATNNDSAFAIHSLQVVASALSNAQILAEYNRTMGPVFGER